MSLLSEFVSALLPAERLKLTEIPLHGKQAAILDAVLRDPYTEKFVQAEATALGMSPTHLYTTQSVLLERSYQALVPEGGIDLLVLLGARGLETHYKKAMHTIERAIHKKSASQEELHEFYSRLLHLMITGTTIRFDKRKFASVLAFYERTRIVTHPDDGLCREVLQLSAELQALIVSPTRTRPTADATKLLGRLDDLKLRMSGCSHPEARFYIRYAYVCFYATLDKNPEKFAICSEQLLEVVDDLPQPIANEERRKLALRAAARSYMQGDFREAFRRYGDQHREFGDGLLSRYSYHLDRYLRTSLALREYATAERLIEIGYPLPPPQAPSSPIGAARGLYETMLHLLRHEIEPARRSLRRAQRQNSGVHFGLSLDLMLRFLEVILEMLNGSPQEYVEKLTIRALKHMSRKGMTLKTGEDEVVAFHALKDVLEGRTASENVGELLGGRLAMQPALELLVKDVLNAEARQRGRASAN